jgi:hypothetical protein
MATNRVPVVIVNGEMRQLPVGDILSDSTNPTLRVPQLVTSETSTGTSSVTWSITNFNPNGVAGWVLSNDSLATLFLAVNGTTRTPSGLLLANAAFFQCNLESVFVLGCSSAFDFSVNAGVTRVMRLKQGLRIGTGSTDPGLGNLTVEGVIAAGTTPTTLNNAAGQLLFSAQESRTKARLNLAIIN